MSSGQRFLGVTVGGQEDNDANEKRSVKSKEVDFESGSADATIVAPVYYNPTTLKFEWAQRPYIDIADLTVSMGDVEKLLSESYWKVKQFDYTSGDLDYMGCNTDIAAADGDTDWYLWKYTWVAGNCTKILGPAIGSWTNRALAF